MKSERLQRAFDAGSVMDLFPILKDWSTDELQALVKDAEKFTSHADKKIDAAWEATIFKSEVFFNSAASKEADALREMGKLEIMMIMSEICSVAFFYLEERGVKVE